jgi:hypothetical protein
LHLALPAVVLHIFANDDDDDDDDDDDTKRRAPVSPV